MIRYEHNSLFSSTKCVEALLFINSDSASIGTYGKITEFLLDFGKIWDWNHS